MAKGAAPSQDQLLELLKRAADELKHSQEEARTAIVALQKEQAAHGETERELEGAKEKLKGSSALQTTDEQLLKDQIDAERENGAVLGARVKDLEAELKAAAAEHESLRKRAADADTAISVSQQQEEAKRTALMTEHANALDALKAEHAKALEATQAEKAVFEARQQQLLDDAAGQLVQTETQLNQEREKHQTTAQKLLETRARARELESTLAAEQERINGLETAAKQMADSHEKALTEATQKLSTRLEQTQAELTKATQAWQQVERQYEALHREMLLTLEQRDDARRQLDTERTERERLSRTLQGHRT